MIVVLLLLVLNAIVFYTTREPRAFVEVKEKYRILRDHIQETDDSRFKVLTRVIPITGMKKMTRYIGSNTNKGDEIIICLDGEVNEIFHVLLHELAHSTVDEYSHSEQFWDNYTALRNIAVELGIYEQIPEKTKFCGRHVQDK